MMHTVANCRVEKKQTNVVECAKGTSYPVATLRVLTVTNKFDRLHGRKRLSRYKKEKCRSTFSKRVERVALHTCA